MATAREVRANVRAQLAAQLAGRQKTALSVAAACAKVEQARERLAAAERDAASTLATASTTVPLAELATLAGVPASTLRRLSRAGKHPPADHPTTPAQAPEPAAVPTPDASGATGGPSQSAPGGQPAAAG